MDVEIVHTRRGLALQTGGVEIFDVVGVTVSLRENEGFRNFLATRKDFGKFVVESADDSAYLI